MSTEQSKPAAAPPDVSAEGEIARPAKRERSTWQALKEDDTFRATFVVVFVIPALLMAGTVTWIVRAMALS
jgi:hypothetical protein